MRYKVEELLRLLEPMYKYLRLSILALITTFSLNGFSCTPYGTPLVATNTVGSDLIVTVTSATTWGCDYTYELELQCAASAYTGNATYTSGVLNGGAPNSYAPYTIDMSTLCPGDYKFRVREKVASYGGTGPWSAYSADEFFTVGGTQMTITASASPASICFPGNSTLTVTPANVCGAMTYTWDNGAGTGLSVNVSPAATTTYTVTATDANSCITLTESVTVTAAPAVVPGVADVLDVCLGTPSVLTIVGEVGTIQWQSAPTSTGPWTDIVGATTNPYDAGALSPGDDTFFMAIITSCGIDTTNIIEATVFDLPLVDAGLDQVLCDGDQTSLNGAGAVTYAWSGGVTDGDLFTPVVGTTTYTVTGTDANSCINTDDIDVLVNALPIVDAGADQTVCDGLTVTLNGSGAVSYTWDGGITDGVSFTPLVGTTTFMVTGTDGNTCVNTDVVDVTVDPLDDPSFNYPLGVLHCQTGTNPTVEFTGMTGGTFYTSVVSGGPTIDIVPNNGTINLAGSDAGVYTVTYTTMGAPTSLCPQQSSVNITIGSPPEADFYIDDYCDIENDPVPTFLLGGVPGVFISTEGLLIDPSNGQVNLSGSVPGQYTITNTVSVVGCADVVYTDDMIIYETPIASFSYLPQVANTENTQVEFTNATLFADSYEWDFGDQTPISNVESPGHEFPVDVPGQYTVTLIAYNGSSVCTDTISRIVYVEEIIIFYIPNAFTPDGDDYNETFQPIFYSGHDPYDFHFMIFDRWGEIVWESYNPSAGWDGTYGDGGLVEDGTYIWTLDFRETMSDKRHEHNGHVTVLK